jgi:hypothetical protein
MASDQFFWMKLACVQFPSQPEFKTMGPPRKDKASVADECVLMQAAFIAMTNRRAIERGAASDRAQPDTIERAIPALVRKLEDAGVFAAGHRTTNAKRIGRLRERMLAEGIDVMSLPPAMIFSYTSQLFVAWCFLEGLFGASLPTRH